jgi:hypothetical protein
MHDSTNLYAVLQVIAVPYHVKRDVLRYRNVVGPMNGNATIERVVNRGVSQVTARARVA